MGKIAVWSLICIGKFFLKNSLLHINDQTAIVPKTRIFLKKSGSTLSGKKPGLHIKLEFASGTVWKSLKRPRKIQYTVMLTYWANFILLTDILVGD